MRILIVATYRSGSTTLSGMIGNILDYFIYNEPFNFRASECASKIFPKKLPNECVVKTIIDQLPSDDTNILDFYANYVNEFDKVILLSRKNKQEVYESILYRITYFEHGDWHTPYIYEELTENEEIRNIVNAQRKLIESLSQIVNIPITWYEDIYYGDKELVECKIKEWNIDTISYENSKEYLNPKYRYRRQIKTIL